jgi:beta-glucanase (GH16 family)
MKNPSGYRSVLRLATGSFASMLRTLNQFFKGNTTSHFPKIMTLAITSCVLVAMITIDASASGYSQGDASNRTNVESTLTSTLSFSQLTGSAGRWQPWSPPANPVATSSGPPLTTTFAGATTTTTPDQTTTTSPQTTTTSPQTTTTTTSVASSSPQPVGDIAGPWNLVFDSEFNGSSLDASQWSPGAFGTGYTGPIDPAYGLDVCAASQVSVGSGSLQIKAILQTNTSAKGTFPYTSGAVTTMAPTYPWTSPALFSFTYGYAEARIWLPGSGGIADWPAFWMFSTALSHTYPNGEIDILEGLGGSAEAHLISSLGAQGPLTGGGTYAGGWHTFAADWEPGAITYYYDGVSIGSFTTEIPSTPMFLLLDLDVSTTLSPPAAPASMLVDYVRVWQH